VELTVTLLDCLEGTPVAVGVISTLLSCLGRGTKAPVEREMAKESSTVSFDSFIRTILYVNLCS
jgi:hypothetical protein